MALSLELLSRSIDMRTGSKFYKIAKNCSSLMMFLVNDMLDFSQLEAKKLVLNIMDGVSISQLIKESIELLSFKAENKGIILS